MVREEFVWRLMRDEADLIVASEPAISVFLQKSILDHTSFLDALSHCLADQLVDVQWTNASLKNIFKEALESDRQIIINACLDLSASFERDAACDKYLTPLLYFKGFQALQLQRVANWYWRKGRIDWSATASISKPYSSLNTTNRSEAKVRGSCSTNISEDALSINKSDTCTLAFSSTA